METFWQVLYNAVGIPVIYAAFSLAALFRPKVRRGMAGRKRLFERLETALDAVSAKGPRFWIHNSSMGEFEQAKPLVETIKKRFPQGSVVVSFFSPSGYDPAQAYRGADALCYIPFDSLKNVNRFLNTLQPDAAVVIRHDMWPNLLWQTRKRGIPLILANCSIRPHAVYSLPATGSACRSVYRAFDEILAVSPEAKAFCQQHRFSSGRIAVVGDTRYDRVVCRAREAEGVVAPLRKLKRRRLGFVAGSTWPSDEDVILPVVERFIREGIRIWTVLVPHEPTPEHLAQVEDKLRKLGLRFVRLSNVLPGTRTPADVLLVDRIGILASLYALGEVCYVGGGFGPGVHNVLEPAALGKPVLFGPRCRNSYEAGQLEKRGVGFVVNDAISFQGTLQPLLRDSRQMHHIGRMAARLVKENVGATDRIVRHLARLVRP